MHRQANVSKAKLISTSSHDYGHWGEHSAAVAPAQSRLLSLNTLAAYQMSRISSGTRVRITSLNRSLQVMTSRDHLIRDDPGHVILIIGKPRCQVRLNDPALNSNTPRRNHGLAMGVKSSKGRIRKHIYATLKYKYLRTSASECTADKDDDSGRTSRL